MQERLKVKEYFLFLKKSSPAHIFSAPCAKYRYNSGMKGRQTDMKMTNDEYKKYSERHAPRSPVGPHMLWAFVVGGLICCFGQFLLNLYGAAGLDKETAATATSVSLVFLGALFTGLGLYDKLAEKAGAGTLVPITGFSNSVVSPALEFKTEGLVTGTAAKMFIIAGPVIVYGISASVIYGLILCLIG